MHVSDTCCFFSPGCQMKVLHASPIPLLGFGKAAASAPWCTSPVLAAVARLKPDKGAGEVGKTFIWQIRENIYTFGVCIKNATRCEVYFKYAYMFGHIMHLCFLCAMLF